MIKVSAKKNQENRLGRPGNSENMTPQQIQAEAIAVMEKGLSSAAWHALDLLYAGGIMTVSQLGLTSRTLRKYANRHIVDRYALSSNYVADRLGEYDLMVEYGQLYTLGPVGAKIVEMRHGVKPSSGYLSYPLERVLHDVIVNEIVFRIAAAAEAHGWEMNWASKYEATLFRNETPILEPDAFISLEREGEVFPLLIEYHNEDKRTRAVRKVYRYESAYQSEVWQDTWDILDERFPPVLAVFRKSIVHDGYKEACADAAPLACNFYGRSLGGFLDDMNDWYYYNEDSKAQIFPWLR